MNLKIRTQITLSSVYQFAYFPFSVRELIEALPRFGFTIASPDNASRQRFGGRLNLPAPLIAYRGPIEFSLAVSGQAISIRATDFQTARDSLKEIEEYLLSELHFESTREAVYHQGHLQGSVAVATSPIAAWQRVSEHSDLVQRMTQIIGQPVQSYGIHLTTLGHNPNTYEWLDIRLEPDVQSADRQYMYDFLYRNPDQSSAFALAQRAEDIVRQLVLLVQEETVS